MAKRIKRVFTNADQVLHLWVNQSQEDARCKNVFFEGKSCYSYGKHYELGRLVEYNRVTVAIINDIGYSNTTSKHIHSALNATSHLITLRSKNGFDVRESLVRMQGEVIDIFMSLMNGRKAYAYNLYTDKTDEWGSKNYCYEKVEVFNEYCTRLGHKELILDLDQEFINVFNAHIQSIIDRTRLKDAEKIKKIKQREIERKNEELKAKEDLQMWLNGGEYTRSLSFVRPERIRINGNIVESTKRAEVSMNKAMDLLKAIDKGLKPIGYEIDGFTVDEIDGDIITIGCHQISISEARNVLTEKAPVLQLVK